MKTTSTISTATNQSTGSHAPPTPPVSSGTSGAVAPLAASNVVIDQVRPMRIGNSGFGILTGTFVDASVGGPLYQDALAIIAGRFLPTPPPRITFTANAILTNEYTFIAVGRNV